MNLDDFRYMRRGSHLALVKPGNARLLEPIDKHNGKIQKALLVLHGFSSTPAVFRQMVPAFESYDAVVIPALPGHGSTLELFSAMKADDLLRFTEQICAELTSEYQHVDVMGLSLGGLLACHLATLFPVHHLWLLAPALDLHLAISKITQLAKCLAWLGFYRVRNAAGNLFTSQHSEITYRQLSLSSIMELLKLVHEFQFTPPACPTDLFLGKHDEVVASQLVADRFSKSSNTTIHWLENSAHVLPLDGDTETIIRCIREANKQV